MTTAAQSKEIMMSAATWVNFKNIMLSEKNSF
jgi:hypothetical protein